MHHKNNCIDRGCDDKMLTIQKEPQELISEVVIYRDNDEECPAIIISARDSNKVDLFIIRAVGKDDMKLRDITHGNSKGQWQFKGEFERSK